MDENVIMSTSVAQFFDEMRGYFTKVPPKGHISAVDLRMSESAFDEIPITKIEFDDHSLRSRKNTEQDYLKFRANDSLENSIDRLSIEPVNDASYAKSRLKEVDPMIVEYFNKNTEDEEFKDLSFSTQSKS
jgi:hypothetical protein